MWLLGLAPLLLPLCLSSVLNGDGSGRWQKTINCVTKTDENNSSVTCLFGFDVAQKDKEYDFNVISIDPASNKEDPVLVCSWIIKGQPPECKIDEGYRFDNTNINDKTTLFVPPEILNSGYKFQCQISPTDANIIAQPCDKNTTCKEGVHINTTTPIETTTEPSTTTHTTSKPETINYKTTTESTTEPSTTTQTATTAKPETIVETSPYLNRLEIIIISSVAVLVVVITVGVVFLYRKLKPRSQQLKDQLLKEPRASDTAVDSRRPQTSSTDMQTNSGRPQTSSTAMQTNSGRPQISSTAMQTDSGNPTVSACAGYMEDLEVYPDNSYNSDLLFIDDFLEFETTGTYRKFWNSWCTSRDEDKTTNIYRNDLRDGPYLPVDTYGEQEGDEKTSNDRTITLSSSPSPPDEEDENQSDDDSMHTASENSSLLEIEPPNDNGGQKPT